MAVSIKRGFTVKNSSILKIIGENSPHDEKKITSPLGTGCISPLSFNML